MFQSATSWSKLTLPLNSQHFRLAMDSFGDPLGRRFGLSQAHLLGHPHCPVGQLYLQHCFVLQGPSNGLCECFFGASVELSLMILALCRTSRTLLSSCCSCGSILTYIMLQHLWRLGRQLLRVAVESRFGLLLLQIFDVHGSYARSCQLCRGVGSTRFCQRTSVADPPPLSYFDVNYIKRKLGLVSALTLD